MSDLMYNSTKPLEEFEVVKKARKRRASGDLVSREDAIKAINDLPNCPNGYSDTYDKARIIGVLEELPSANQWIPCSERLPQEMEDVLVDDGIDMFVAWRYKGKWGSSDNNLDEHTPILAWMPITPYKESE